MLRQQNIIGAFDFGQRITGSNQLNQLSLKGRKKHGKDPGPNMLC